MITLSNKATILVCTCDSYSDLWYPFFKLLAYYWPNLDCKIILNTETKSFAFEGLQIDCYSMGSDSYGQRMIDHLEKITTDYTILLLDDFFLRRPVNVNTLEKIVDRMDNDPDIAAFYCNKSEFCKDGDNICGFYELKRYAPYRLNMQAAVWRTEKLAKYWEPKDNPWIWEIFVNYLTFDTADKFYSLRDLSESPIYYGYNPDGMGVFRGKWVENDVKPLFEKHNIVVDYSKRGFYEPDRAIARLPIMKTMPYVFKRLPLKYAFLFSLYEIMKRILRLIGLRPRYLNYNEYLCYSHAY